MPRASFLGVVVQTKKATCRSDGLFCSYVNGLLLTRHFSQSLYAHIPENKGINISGGFDVLLRVAGPVPRVGVDSD